MNRVFLDANIILDILISTRQNHKLAKELWRELILKDIQIVISEDIITNIYYIAKNHTKVLEFLKLIKDEWQIVGFGKSVIDNAIDISLYKKLDLEDVLQCLCAKENGCSSIITNDKKFYDCGVEIYTIEDFLNRDN